MRIQVSAEDKSDGNQLKCRSRDGSELRGWGGVGGPSSTSFIFSVPVLHCFDWHLLIFCCEQQQRTETLAVMPLGDVDSE